MHTRASEQASECYQALRAHKTDHLDVSGVTAPQNQDKASLMLARGPLTHAFTRTMGNSLGLSIDLTEPAPHDADL